MEHETKVINRANGDFEKVVFGGGNSTKRDAINPDHYKKYPIEVIDMMIAIFGVQAAINYCTMTAFKYRMRLGHKDDISQELKKKNGI